MSPRLLIAEDDFAIANNVFTYFERVGFAVEMVHNGHAALHRCSVDRYDVVLLDIGLPGLDGLSFMDKLRMELRVATPVIVMSARSDLGSKLEGFARGVDDYVAKPFALAELEARVRAVLARASGRSSVDPVRRCGALEFNPATREARVGGAPLRLTPKSAQLLELLMQRPGELVKREDIRQSLWGGAAPQADALRSQVYALRKALSDAGFDGIDTVHSQGYRLVQPSG